MPSTDDYAVRKLTISSVFLSMINMPKTLTPIGSAFRRFRNTLICPEYFNTSCTGQLMAYVVNILHRRQEKQPMFTIEATERERESLFRRLVVRPCPRPSCCQPWLVRLIDWLRLNVPPTHIIGHMGTDDLVRNWRKSYNRNDVIILSRVNLLYNNRCT